MLFKLGAADQSDLTRKGRAAVLALGPQVSVCMRHALAKYKMQRRAGKRDSGTEDTETWQKQMQTQKTSERGTTADRSSLHSAYRM